MTGIRNGTLVLPQGLLPNGSIRFEGEKIASLGPMEKDAPLGASLDARGGYILPGFIDLHLHGGGGADFMDGTPEAFRIVAQTHCRFGTTAMTPTTLSCSGRRLDEILRVYDEVSKQETGGADFLGLHLEGPYFAAATKGAQSGQFLETPQPEETERVLSLGQGQIVRWDAAPELDGMECFARQLKAHGVMTSIAHTDATAEQTLRAFDWGFSHATHCFCAMSSRRKREQIVCDGAVEAALLRDGVTLELIADGKHVPRESFLLAVKLKGAGGVALITDATRSTGTDAKESYLGSYEEGIPVLIEDGVAKLMDRSFFAGSIATCDRALRVALDYGVSLTDASRMLSATPARLLNVQARKGSLEVGKDADIVVMDASYAVQAVFVRGRRMF